MRLRLSLVLAALSALCLLPARSAADLVWSPATGWRVEGGVLGSLDGPEGRTALDLMNKARSAEESRSYRSALSAYARVAKKYPNSVYAAEALYRSGLIRQQRHEYFKAFEAYQQMVSRYPNSEKFSQVVGEQYRVASFLLEGKRNYLFGVIPGFKNREKSLEYFEQIVANAPYSDYAPLSLMNVARGQQRLGNTEEAIDALDRMINSYPRNVLTPDAYLKLAQTHASLVAGPAYDQQSTKEAITYYEDFMILYPGDPGVASAEKGLGDMKRVLAQSKMVIADYYYEKRRNYKAAKVFYNEAITVYPDSDVAAKARARLTDVEARLAGQTPKVTPADHALPTEKPKKKKRFFFF
ncbi:MAG: outer membrane protein assembly factor BamD [Opitutae bacterium]|nr:outer membrane protein assembly factor BamD [Opitutae bacterium]